MRPRRLLWTAPALFVLAACGQTPQDTEKARGVLEGVPFVLAMSVIFVVLAIGAIGVAIVLDRAVRSRQRLAAEPPVSEEEPEEEPDEIVAGITVRRAPVPRWLYAAYVLVPVFALAYVMSNVAVAPAQQAQETPAPAEGPCTECLITASQIKFDKDTLEVVAGEEITVSFDNQDTGVPHDFTAWADKAAADAGGEPIATTGTIAGGNQGEATFAADEATYFNCTIHPASMVGDFEPVEG